MTTENPYIRDKITPSQEQISAGRHVWRKSCPPLAGPELQLPHPADRRIIGVSKEDRSICSIEKAHQGRECYAKHQLVGNPHYSRFGRIDLWAGALWPAGEIHCKSNSFFQTGSPRRRCGVNKR